MERRRHHRVRLHLPARLRWTTPLGQRLEFRETLDLSRGGLLVTSEVAAEAGAQLWITLPYDSSLPEGQPEVPARVVRSELPSDLESRLAIRFDVPALPSRNGHSGLKPGQERRSSPRQHLSIPVRVRLEHLPWFEEAMTLDVSSTGLRFLSTREYQPGARLLLSFDPAAPSPWPPGENHASVVSAAILPDGTALFISVRRLS